MTLRARRSAGALDAVQADAAGPDHGDTCAGRDLRRVHHRAEAGDDAAGQQRGAVEGDLRGDRHHLRFIDHGIFGEGGGIEAVGDGLAVLGRERIFSYCGKVVSHCTQIALGAIVATAAGAEQGHDDVVARLDLVTPAPTRFTTPAASWP